VRFAPLPAFEAYARTCDLEPDAATGAMEVFVDLLESVVDHLADGLERENAALEDASRRVFHPQTSRRARRRADVELRGLLREIGLAGDQAGRLRDTLLGVGRIAQFVPGSVGDWISADQRTRFKTLRADIRSLADYQARLAETVQFLLDATLGLINIEQNNVIKVLTIVSIVGIPPTFIASLYGMNFKDIPELNWSFGYWYALGLMLATGLAPLVWFRLRGWL
jgi:magnesium transporter